jgi:hypothetical protein
MKAAPALRGADRSTAPFARIEHDVLSRTDLTPTDKLVYGLIRKHEDRKGKAWPSQETLAAEADRSVSTIRRSLSHLKAAGCIQVKRRGLTKTNVYRTIEQAPTRPELRLVESGEPGFDRSPASVPDRSMVSVPDRSPVSGHRNKTQRTRRTTTTVERVGDGDAVEGVEWLTCDDLSAEVWESWDVVTRARWVFAEFNRINVSGYVYEVWRLKIEARVAEQGERCDYGCWSIGISKGLSQEWIGGDATPGVIFGSAKLCDAAMNATPGSRLDRRRYDKQSYD